MIVTTQNCQTKIEQSFRTPSLQQMIDLQLKIQLQQSTGVMLLLRGSTNGPYVCIHHAVASTQFYIPAYMTHTLLCELGLDHTGSLITPVHVFENNVVMDYGNKEI